MAKITHACGHTGDYKGVKDKKAWAARPCFACEHAASAAPAETKAPKPVRFWVEKRGGGPGVTYHVIVPEGVDPVRYGVVEAAEEVAYLAYYEPFDTLAAAEARVREYVAAGRLVIIVGESREKALARTRSMLESQAEDAREAYRPKGRVGNSSGFPTDDDIRSLEGNEDL